MINSTEYFNLFNAIQILGAKFNIERIKALDAIRKIYYKYLKEMDALYYYPRSKKEKILEFANDINDICREYGFKITYYKPLEYSEIGLKAMFGEVKVEREVFDTKLYARLYYNGIEITDLINLTKKSDVFDLEEDVLKFSEI